MRKIVKERKTRETKIKVALNIDGKGNCNIKTGIDFLDHMLTLFAYHGFFDLTITAKGDTNIDIHHTNEDIGIVLGQAFKDALGNKKGIQRFGSAMVPMEEVLATVSLDICGRGFFKNIEKDKKTTPNIKDDKGYAFAYADHFFESFAKNLGMNLNIQIRNTTSDIHTNLEPVFKAFGLALDQATQIDPRRKEVPSTKGIID